MFANRVSPEEKKEDIYNERCAGETIKFSNTEVKEIAYMLESEERIITEKLAYETVKISYNFTLPIEVARELDLP